MRSQHALKNVIIRLYQIQVNAIERNNETLASAKEAKGSQTLRVYPNAVFILIQKGVWVKD